MKLQIIKGELPKRKETESHKIKPLPEYNEGWVAGFNQCLDEIETVEISEEDIAKTTFEYLKGRSYDDATGEEIYKSQGVAKAIMKLGGGE